MGFIEDLYVELNQLAKNPANVKDYSRFHKDGKKHISLSSSVTKKLYAEKFKQVKHLDYKQILVFCEKLLEYKESSCRGMAFDWAFRIRKKYKKEDFSIFEKWLNKYVDTWGSCDDFCTHALGYFLLEFPEFLPELNRWTKSKNMWVRRASAVILIYGLRKNKFIDKTFEIATILLQDQEDLVQKGYGWMLKEAGNKYQKQVFDFVMKNKAKMSRTALRYAIEKIPPNLKKAAMAR